MKLFQYIPIHRYVAALILFTVWITIRRNRTINVIKIFFFSNISCFKVLCQSFDFDILYNSLIMTGSGINACGTM